MLAAHSPPYTRLSLLSGLTISSVGSLGQFNCVVIVVVVVVVVVAAVVAAAGLTLSRHRKVIATRKFNCPPARLQPLDSLLTHAYHTALLEEVSQSNWDRRDGNAGSTKRGVAAY